MNCDKAIGLVLEIIEDTIDPATKREIMTHLNDCPPCLRFLETYRKTTHLCAASLKTCAPAELTQRLMTFLRERAKKPTEMT